MCPFSISHSIDSTSQLELRRSARLKSSEQLQTKSSGSLPSSRGEQHSATDAASNIAAPAGTKRKATDSLAGDVAKRVHRGASEPSGKIAASLSRANNLVTLYDIDIKSKFNSTVLSIHDQSLKLAKQEIDSKPKDLPLETIFDPIALHREAENGPLHSYIHGTATSPGLSDTQIESVAQIIFERNQLAALQQRIAKIEQPTGLNQIFSKYRGKQRLFQQHISQIEFTAVMTSHPSEVRSREGLEAQYHLSRIMNTSPKSSSDERKNTTHRLVENIRLFHDANYGKATPLSRPTVSDEVDNLLKNFERSIFTGVSTHLNRVSQLNSATFDRDALSLPRYLSFHSWVGGDRDGNPNVTHEETLTAGRKMRKAIIARYRNELSRARADLGRADSAHQMHDRILEIEEKLINTAEARREIINTVHGPKHRFYKNAGELHDDLVHVILDAKNARDETLVQQLNKVDNLVNVFGLHLASLEWRQHSNHVLKTLSELAFHNDGHSSVELEAGLPQVDDAVKNILKNQSQLITANESTLSSDAAELLASLRALATLQHESGNQAVTELIVANTDSAAPILALQRLVHEIDIPVKNGNQNDAHDEKFGLRNVQIVPLFESIDSLQNAPRIVGELLDNPAFRAHIDKLGKRFEIMVGYSDSAKDGGRFASDIMLRNAQIAIADVCTARGVEPFFFHGRGGSLGRGYAEPEEAFEPLHPKIPAGKLKQTEQGEVVANRFGDPDLAAHYLDRCFVEALNAIEKNEAVLPSTAHAGKITQIPGQSAEELQPMVTRMADTARESYQELYNRPTFARDYHALTAIQHVSSLTISSRPTQRNGKGFNVNTLRAVPYNMGANAAFAPFLSWYGTGGALQHEIGLGNLQHLAHAYLHQPTFRHSLDRAIKAYENTDLTGLTRNFNPQNNSQLLFLASLAQESKKLREGLQQVLQAAGSDKKISALSDLPSANTPAYKLAIQRRLIIEFLYTITGRKEQGTLRARTAPQTTIAAAVSIAGVSG